MTSEKTLLLEHLDEVQRSLLWKVEGLTDDALRRPMTPTGTNLIGIVKHLTGITHGYLVEAFGQERDEDRLTSELDEELFHGLDMWATPEESTDELVAAYRRACAAGARTIEELDLDATGNHHTGNPVTLREMVLTVLLDTTRHTGHADVVRELTDGRVGARPGDPMSPDDEEYLRMYRARITGEIDRDTWMAYVKSLPDYDPSAWPEFLARVRPGSQSQAESGSAGFPSPDSTSE
ncbi:DinB family protein [Kribbella sp. C-35]|uniref:DinB family protein n=1 Tax=Kribbella sp. C-35 TaxID=2789276 RepID=UPI00397E8059